MLANAPVPSQCETARDALKNNKNAIPLAASSLQLCSPRECEHAAAAVAEGTVHSNVLASLSTGALSLCRCGAMRCAASIAAAASETREWNGQRPIRLLL